MRSVLPARPMPARATSLPAFDLQCGETHAAQRMIARLAGQGFPYEPDARLRLLLDIPRGFALRMLEAGAARAARLVVISDMLGDAEAMLAAARLRVAAKGEVILVHIVATEEIDPPAQALLAVDPEDPTMRRLLDGAMRTQYRERFMAWLDEMASSARSAGIRYVRATTDEPAAHLVRRVAGETARRGA